MPDRIIAAIWVRQLRRLTAAQLGDAIAAYWVARGARLEAQPSTAVGARSVAIALDDKRFYVSDSERVHADFGLANHLADTLQTRVHWYRLADTKGALRVLGPGQAVRAPRDTYADVVDYLDRLTMRCWDYDQLATLFDGIVHRHFSRITQARYNRGPAL